MDAASNQSGEMRHVDQEECAYFVGNLAHAREIDDARIGAASANDQFGTFFLRQFLEVVVIDGFGVLGHAVRNDAVSLAGKIEMMAVGKVSAMGQIQAQDGVARLQNRRESLHVGLRSGMRLHIGVLGAKEFLRPFTRQIFHHIGKFAAAVVALARISLGIFVRKDRAHGFEHGFADEVL